MGLKKLYYSLEDKYYNFVEKTGIYKFTDKIDKFMPSFIFFILLLIIIIAGIFLLLPGGEGQPSDYSLYFTIKDEDSIALENIALSVSCDNGNVEKNLITDQYGTTNKVYAPKDSSCLVSILDPNYEAVEKSYILDQKEKDITIILDSIQPEEKVNYSFSVVDSQTSSNISSGRVDFFCSNQEATPPESINFTNGLVEVEANANCNLQATITANNYTTLYQQPISPADNILQMESEVINFSDTYDLDIYVKDTAGDPVSNIEIKAFRDGIIQATAITDSGGYCKLESLDSANYTIRASDQRQIPEYTNKETEIYLNSNDYTNIILDKEIQGYIKVKVLDHVGVPLEGANVSLKVYDQEISSGYTNENGIKLFAVTDKDKDYRVVVNVEGYMVAAQLVTPVVSLPSEPTTIIELEQINSSTYKPLNLRVVDEEGKGYSHAQVVLFDSDTGFLTDFEPKTSDYNGEVTFIIPSGNYYAKAIKGSSIGTSADFSFDVANSQTMGTIVIPMTISKGYLEVRAVNEDGDPLQNIKIDVFDKFNGEDPIESDLTNASGIITKEVDADQKLYVKASDPLGSLGTTQSSYINIYPEDTSTLEVTMYNKRQPSSKPELIFNGLYRNDHKMTGNLKSGQEYEAKYTLFVPSNRSGYRRFRYVGALLSLGSKIYVEQESLYIKDISVGGDPSILSVKKYNKYEDGQDYLDLEDLETQTLDDAKWASIIFNEDGYTYNTAYEISATIKIKESAVFGEDLIFNYIGYGYNRDHEYEIKSKDDEEIDVDEITQTILDETRFNIGSETACDDQFCFTMDIIDTKNELRDTVVSEYTAAPEVEYVADFTIINNTQENVFTNARIQIINPDEGLDFEDIDIKEHTGNTININPEPREYEFDEELSNLDSKRSLNGTISFKPILKGERHLQINFISDQQIIFSKNIIIHVLSDKTFDVDISPDLLPAYKPNLNLEVEVKDSDSGFAINDDVYVSLKDKYLNEIQEPKLVGANGKVSINVVNALQEEDILYVYVQSPEYETYVEEIGVTDEIFTVNPSTLGVSLNVETKESEKILFNISNLIENDLKVKSMEFKGDRDNIKYIDAARVNNLLESYSGTLIEGIDNDDVTANYDTEKDFDIEFTLSNRSEEIYKVQNIKSYLVITMQDAYDSSLNWSLEIPVNITIGFNGMFDNASCITTSRSNWEEVVQNKSAKTQFNLENGCTINSNSVPLRNGLQAKVEFESNPLGTFNLSVGNRITELSTGYFKTIFDSVDREKSYPVVLEYTPDGRFTGDIKGKIIFKSVNTTTSGDQDIINEFTFNLHVISLQDCYVLSKKLLEIKDSTNADSFTIENKGCGQATNYRLSCDDCQGLIVQPFENIKVDETGSSGDIVVKAVGAMPGMYLLHVYSKVDGQRGSEKHVGQIKVKVRPVGKCIDLDRYEFNLYRSTISENTGQQLATSSYDTANIINTCYKQDIRIEGKVANNDRLGAAFASGISDGFLTFLGSEILQGIFNTGGSSFLGNLIYGDDSNKKDTQDPCANVTCEDGNVCKEGKCVVEEKDEKSEEKKEETENKCTEENFGNCNKTECNNLGSKFKWNSNISRCVENDCTIYNLNVCTAQECAGLGKDYIIWSSDQNKCINTTEII